MDGQLKPGTLLISESQSVYEVVSLLGAGGQGEVYDVICGGHHFALKWYYPHMATKQQKELIDNLIMKGSPSPSFLWALDMIFTEYGKSFGYIMPLRPQNYKGIVDMMKRRVEPSFLTLCKAAFELTKGYQKLHEMGYSYRDISFGNVFFDPDTGDVLICDNDNVSANGLDNASVYGTPRFMAPEIVVGKAIPSRNTDLYSLAVLLFYMFMMGHPLEGKLEADIKCMDILAMNQIYGSDALFVYDPDDKKNRPVPGYQDNVIIFWGLYPKSLRDLFTRAFTVGLKSPGSRVTEQEWLDEMTSLLSGIISCPDCGAEVFYDASETTVPCWSCHSDVPIPVSLSIGKLNIMIQKHSQIVSQQLFNDHDIKTVVGTVTQNPQNPDLWGIRNDSRNPWVYIKPDGTQKPVPVGKNAAIARGVRIDFGGIVGEFK